MHWSSCLLVLGTLIQCQAAEAAVLSTRTAQATSEQVTPVGKVLQMLEGMITKGLSMAEEEKRTFAEYSKWVDSRSTELKQEIATQESSIEDLTATIDTATTKNKHLTKAIKSLDAEMDKVSSEKEEAMTVRRSDRAEYVKAAEDLSESVSALARAIDEIEAQNYDRPQAEALLQKMASKSPALQPALAAFLQDGDSAVGAPSVAAYKFQSQGILDVLGQLKEKFDDTLSDLQTEEGNKAHAHELEDLHLSNLLTQLKADRQEKATTNSEVAALAGRSKGELADTQADLAENEKLLTEVEATYSAKTATFEMNQKVRDEELKALKEAKEIIASPEVAESYSENIALAQSQKQSQALAFLQTAVAAHQQMSQRKAAAFLQSRAKFLSSEALSSMARQMAAKPFEKVINMIEALLAKLKEEAAAEAEHKAWCDKELKRNKQKRDKKAMEAEKLTASIAEAEASIASMAKEIAELSNEQAELTAALKEATALRTKEKAENEETIKDAKAGQEAVGSALSVLQKFYGGGGALIQQRQVPEMEEYKGMSGSKKGVVGMLEVIQSDFARLAADTMASEEQAAREYNEFAAETKTATEEKHKAEVKLKLQKDQAEFELGRMKESLADVEAELQKANEYFSYLKPTCLEVHVSFEERVQRRQEEISALKEAYRILGEKSSE